MLAKIIRRAARGVAHVFADMDYAQRRVAVLTAAPDRLLPAQDKNRAPTTYAEFLLRTSGPLLREPSAAARGRGLLVRLRMRLRGPGTNSVMNLEPHARRRSPSSAPSCGCRAWR